MSISPRIMKETKDLIDDPLPGIVGSPSDGNARLFKFFISGPSDSPYEGGVFELELFLPDKYPMVAPIVYFKTKIFHPNIDIGGNICLDTIKEKWSPAFQIRTVLISIQVLLTCPNPDSALNSDAGRIWNNDIKKAHQKAKEWTKIYATSAAPSSAASSSSSAPSSAPPSTSAASSPSSSSASSSAPSSSSASSSAPPSTSAASSTYNDSDDSDDSD